MVDMRACTIGKAPGAQKRAMGMTNVQSSTPPENCTISDSHGFGGTLKQDPERGEREYNANSKSLAWDIEWGCTEAMCRGSPKAKRRSLGATCRQTLWAHMQRARHPPSDLEMESLTNSRD
jgi:hypothetical protein